MEAVATGFIRQGLGRVMRISANSRGFTIVELLIVIVVIAILAAITIVAYNGIQQRANNSKTVAAVEAYVKAVGLYAAVNGSHPVATSCLGVGYSGGFCRDDNPIYAENGNNFNTVLLAPYLNGATPTPAQVTSQYNASIAMTGAYYIYGSASYNPTGGGIGAIILGTSNCPVISGISIVTSTSTLDGNVLCRYAITL